MQRIIVLGAGMVGRAMAIDLAKDFEVTVVDLNQDVLKELQHEAKLNIQQADLSDVNNVKKLVTNFDLVIGAVPGFMGFQTYKAVIEAGKNIVDISFFEEDALQLDELAKANNVVAVMDCGVAPGMDNIILGYHNEQMKIDTFECLVGGLPMIRTWPYEYKAPFSPIDVIEEYTRPARYVEKGKIVTRPALTDPELLEFDEIGTLESFNSDGLRSIIFTMSHIPNMKEKTLRFPRHIEYMRVLRETGFFSKEPIEINGQMIRPLDFTTKLLFPKWKLGKEEEEFTIMQITIAGEEDGKQKTYQYDILDRYDASTKTSSMARTTGYTCTGVARMILNEMYNKLGSSVPEFIGADEKCYDYMMQHQKERGINYVLTVS